MVVGFTTTYAITTYHHWSFEFESRSGRGVQHYLIRVSQWLATGRWFSLGPPVSSTNKTDCLDITEILLKVALNTIKQTNIYYKLAQKRYTFNYKNIKINNYISLSPFKLHLCNQQISIFPRVTTLKVLNFASTVLTFKIFPTHNYMTTQSQFQRSRTKM